MSDQPVKICLAASGGGHLRQALDLSQAWGLSQISVVSEDSSLARSIADETDFHSVPLFIAGQYRELSPLRFVRAIWANVARSWTIARQIRPDVIITTGAGSVFMTVLFARLHGARVIAVESIARTRQLSKSGHAFGRIAHARILQAKGLQRYWPDAPVFDPICVLDKPVPAKRNLMLVTVGATLPFDRMVHAVDRLRAKGVITEDLIVQTGFGGAGVTGAKTVESMPFQDMLDLLREARTVICHGGSGSILPALQYGCRVIAMPREMALNEHYDDHQLELCGAFADRGMITVARNEEELSAAIVQARAQAPVVAVSDTSRLRDYLRQLIGDWFPNRPQPDKVQESATGMP